MRLCVLVSKCFAVVVINVFINFFLLFFVFHDVETLSGAHQPWVP